MNPALAYHTYFGPAMFAPMARVTLAAARPQRGERVLDVACGTGIVTAQLPSLVGDGRVVGLDLNPAMLEVAAASAGIEWVQGSGTAMEFPDAAFDLVLCQHGLQFFPDRAAGAREMRRVLAPGGRAVIACWRSLDEQGPFASLVRAQTRHIGASDAPFSLGDVDALRALLASAGFTRVAVDVHAIVARFAPADAFVRMAVGAMAAVMPERFATGGAIEPLIAAVAAECSDELARHRDGETLVIPMRANVAVAS